MSSLHIDALSFYIYDAGCVIENSIAKQPYPTGKPDRGQSVLFHKFIQSWVGYELVKVLVSFGLQPTKLNPNLKNWSPDLHDIFSYILTKKIELKDRADQILKVLFDTLDQSTVWVK